MGAIIQRQRRAIEHFYHQGIRNQIRIENPLDNFKLNDGSILYLGGVSQGIGTCSDIKGMNIPVFWQGEIRIPTEKELEVLKNCHYVVLLRKTLPTDHFMCSKDPRILKKSIELLNLDSVNQDSFIIFSRTNQGVAYSSTVSVL